MANFELPGSGGPAGSKLGDLDAHGIFANDAEHDGDTDDGHDTNTKRSPETTQKTEAPRSSLQPIPAPHRPISHLRPRVLAELRRNLR
jgi:hypothetical protein